MTIRWIAIVVVFLSFQTSAADFDEHAFNGHAAISAGQGTPANDVMSVALQWRYAWSAQWSLLFEVSQDSFDFERPTDVVSIAQDRSVATIDASVDQQNLVIGIERRFGEDSANQWFWMVGVGQGRPDVSDAEGPVAGGGNFYIETEAKNEMLLRAGLGYRAAFSEHWRWYSVLRAEYRNTDYSVRDRVSGATGKVDAWILLGLELGLSFAF